MSDQFFEDIRPDQEKAALLHQQSTDKILSTLRSLQAEVDQTHKLHTQAKERLDQFIAAIMHLDPSNRPKILEITKIVRLERGRLYQIRGPK